MMKKIFLPILIYVLIKVAMTGATWLRLSSVRKNISAHINAIKGKPSSSPRSRTTALTIRLKLAGIFTPCILIPGIGEILFLIIIFGGFSSKNKITGIYLRVLQRIDVDNLNYVLDNLGRNNLAVYKTIKKQVGFLSSQGHSEIAKQSLLTLNNLMIDASIAGINLSTDASIVTALQNTSELVEALLREEQSGIQSSIDTYLNVVQSIKNDLIDKKSVFVDAILEKDINTKRN